MDLAENIVINDNTLREGEQAADVSFSVDQKKRLAYLLAEMGVKQIQGGFPGKSKIDMQFVKEIKKAQLPIKVEALSPAYAKDWKEQIDAVVESQADVLGLQQQGSAIRLKYIQKIDENEMIERSIEAVEYAAQSGKIIRFSITDATRTDMDFLKRIIASVTRAGAHRILLSDSVGAILPIALKYLVKEIVNTYNIPVQVHCHNDFGLALANSLAAIEGGASIVDASLNGLGERSGNTCLEEVAVALEIMYGINSGIKLDKLSFVLAEVEKITGINMPHSKPLFGKYAFSHKQDSHVKGLMVNPFLFEAIDPKLIGAKRVFPIGKYSGPFVIQKKMEEFGIKLSDEEIKLVAQEIEEEAIAKKASLSDEELLNIAGKWFK